MYEHSQYSKKYWEKMSPENIIEVSGSVIVFEYWLRTLGSEDLVIQLAKFEEAEMYENCTTINKVLQEKINNITVTHFTKL